MKILETLDGSTTIVSYHFPEQLYHSDRGAVGEAMHTYIKFLREGDNVLEIGFGSGLNALLALESGLNIKYTTIEHYPIDIETAKKLSFSSDYLLALHNAPWEEYSQITPTFAIKKLNLDIERLPSLAAERLTQMYDRIFFDAFAPDIVPRQWSVELFSAIAERMNPGAELLTYSSKGIVKQALRAAGLTVKRLPGALGKHNMVMAIKEN